jgi:hypothetical protein
MNRFPSIALAVLIVLSILFSGCSTYHKVAVWYKYRKDFHLPKALPDPETSLAKATQPIQEAGQGEAVVSARVSKQSHRAYKTSVQNCLPAHLLNSEEVATAAIGIASLTHARNSIWARQDSKDDQKEAQANPAQATPDNRPYHWTAIAGFALALLAFPAFFIFLNSIIYFYTLIFAAGLTLSIISLFKTGESKPYKGRGLGVAGLVLSALDVLMLIAILVAVIVALSSL